MSDLQVTSADSQVIKNVLYDLDESLREAFFKYSLTSEEQVAVVRAFSENFFVDARYDADTAQHTYEVLTSIEKKVKEVNKEGIVKPSTLADYILTTLRVLYLMIKMPGSAQIAEKFADDSLKLEIHPVSSVIYERQYTVNLYAMLCRAISSGVDIKDRDALKKYFVENGGEELEQLAVFVGRERLNYIEADLETDLREFEKLSDDRVLDKLANRIKILSLNTRKIEELNESDKNDNFGLDKLVNEFQELKGSAKSDPKFLDPDDERFFADDEFDFSAESVSSTTDAYGDPMIDLGDNDDFVPQTI